MLVLEIIAASGLRFLEKSTEQTMLPSRGRLSVLAEICQILQRLHDLNACQRYII
jgi:hypothetical protein